MAEKPSVDAQPRPFPGGKRASLWSKMTTSWMDEMLQVGSSRPLRDSDLYDVDEDDTAAKYGPMFEAEWKRQLTRKKPSLWNGICHMFGWDMLRIFALKGMYSATVLTMPKLIEEVLFYLACTDTPTRGSFLPPCAANAEAKAIGFAIGILVIPFAGSLAMNSYVYGAWRLGMRARTGLLTQTFNKTLRLTSSARQDASVGQVVNLMSNDAFTCLMFLAFGFFEMVIAVPTIIICVVMIFDNLSWQAALCGTIVIPATIPVTGILSKQLFAIGAEIVGLADGRIKVENEVLMGIKLLKQNGWEPSFKEKIFATRELELVKIRAQSLVNSGLFSAMNIVPFMMLLVLFSVDAAVRGDMGPAPAYTAFRVITIVNILRQPLIFLPIGAGLAAQAGVAMVRMQKFLLREEVEETAVKTPSTADECIRISGDAQWTWGLVDKGNKADPNKPPGAPGAPGAPAAAKPGAATGGATGAAGSRPPSAVRQPSASGAAAAAGSTDAPKGPSLRAALPDGRPIVIPPGALAAVVGQTGSGKTTLLQALIGEIARDSGTVVAPRKVAYAAQEPWIINATLRENILMGRKFDRVHYDRTLAACQLEQDIAVLPGKDLTEIGERGINLSGGQKARVSLARAVFALADTELFLLDDPLSAVDAHVGRHLFDTCILKTLRNKTRLLVTHRVENLAKCDLVVVVETGRVVDVGRHDELLQRNDHYKLLCESLHEKQQEEDVEAVSPGGSVETADARSSYGHERRPSDAGGTRRPSLVSSNSGVGERRPSLASANSVAAADGHLTELEDRSTGAVTADVWITFFRQMGGSMFLLSAFLLCCAASAANMLNTWWVSYWSEHALVEGYSTGYYGGIMFAITFSHLVLLVARSMVALLGLVNACRALHEGLVVSILKAPMAFFDVTPLGRILNRLSKDQQEIDLRFGMQLVIALNMFFLIAGIMVMQAISVPWVLALWPPLAWFYYKIFGYYIATGRELKRLDSTTYSPIFNHLAETLDGVVTIRAYGHQSQFLKENERRIDLNNRAFLPTFASMCWIGLRMDLPVHLLSFTIAIVAVCLKTRWGYIAPTTVGLALSYGISVSQLLGFFVRTMGEIEKFMTSVQRIQAYSVLEREGQLTEGAPMPPAAWPQSGRVEFRSFSLRYRPNLPPVLKDVSIKIASGEKIGIVGRSGSGKSTMMVALFRLVEPSGGHIAIDGMSIMDIPIEAVRKALTIIPQDPIMFSGTVRYNLDPFCKYTDGQLWEALDRSQLRGAIERLPGHLEHPVYEGGDNFSMGQRQLLCIARAILRRPKVLMLDEATASVDNNNDALIQQMIRREFRECTILTIAHRLVTIIDSDRVLVMDNGQVAEFDTPHTLLQQPQSEFSKLVAETGPAYEQLLKSMAASVAAGQQVDFGNLMQLEAQLPSLPHTAAAAAAAVASGGSGGDVRAAPQIPHTLPPIMSPPRVGEESGRRHLDNDNDDDDGIKGGVVTVVTVGHNACAVEYVAGGIAAQLRAQESASESIRPVMAL